MDCTSLNRIVLCTKKPLKAAKMSGYHTQTAAHNPEVGGSSPSPATKSVTVVDTISTTVIFYLLPFLECCWHETGDIPSIFGHKQIVCLMEKYSLPELDFKYAVVKSLLTIYLRARTSPAMPDSPSTNNPTAPNSGHQWPSDACGSRYGS